MTRKTFLMTATAITLGAGAAMAADTDINAIDANGNGVVDYLEFAAAYPQGTQGLFDLMDVNGDADLDLAELQQPAAQQILENFGAEPFEIKVTADLDEDGNITFDELATTIPGFPAATYASLDLNGDGTLDLLEYNTGTAQVAINAYESSVVYITKSQVDLDGDGILSDAELAQVIPDYEPGTYQQIDAVDTAGRDIFVPVGSITR